MFRFYNDFGVKDNTIRGALSFEEAEVLLKPWLVMTTQLLQTCHVQKLWFQTQQSHLQYNKYPLL